MLWVLLLGFLSTARAEDPAAPADPVPPLAVPVHPVTSPFGVVLDEATRLYVLGDVQGALSFLEELQRRLAFGEPVDPELGAEALVYLGEIYLQQGSTQRAKDAFRAALVLAPHYEVNPYHHPVEVGAYFERMREQLLAEAAERDVPPPPVPRLPIWGYAPLGVPQLAQGQTGRGVLYGSLQLGLGATSIVMLYRLRDENGTIWQPREWEQKDYDEGVPQRVQAQRLAIQWPATLAFYGVWAVSIADGRERWRARPAPMIGPTPAGGASLGLTWRL